MSAPLDDIDSRLLAALLSDGRASATELADAAGIATSTATKRLTSLEDDGVIEGYQPEADYAAFGYDVTAVFRLDIEGSGLAGVVEDLAATDRMVDVYEVTGSDDVVAIGRFTDTDELNAQIRELVTDEHVRTVTTNIVLDTVREYEHPPVVPSNERS
jgi:DNA-binding Lrp family transcriptional regulator